MCWIDIFVIIKFSSLSGLPFLFKNNINKKSLNLMLCLLSSSLIANTWTIFYVKTLFQYFAFSKVHKISVCLSIGGEGGNRNVFHLHKTDLFHSSKCWQNWCNSSWENGLSHLRRSVKMHISYSIFCHYLTIHISILICFYSQKSNNNFLSSHFSPKVISISFTS